MPSKLEVWGFPIQPGHSLGSAPAGEERGDRAERLLRRWLQAFSSVTCHDCQGVNTDPAPLGVSRFCLGLGPVPASPCLSQQTSGSLRAPPPTPPVQLSLSKAPFTQIQVENAGGGQGRITGSQDCGEREERNETVTLRARHVGDFQRSELVDVEKGRLPCERRRRGHTAVQDPSTGLASARPPRAQAGRKAGDLHTPHATAPPFQPLSEMSQHVKTKQKKIFFSFPKGDIIVTNSQRYSGLSALFYELFCIKCCPFGESCQNSSM